MQLKRLAGYWRASGALVMVLLSGCAAMSDSPITDFGNKVLEFVGVIPGAAVFDAAGSLTEATKSMSKEEEYFLGRSVAASLLDRAARGENDALPEGIEDYVARVGATVVAFSDQPETFGGYHFGILNSDEPNAVAAPGGFIFVTRGLLRLMTSEDQLAAVLAHEVSHVEHRDGIMAIRQEAIVDVLKGAGQLAGSLNCSQILQQATVVFGGAVNEVVGTLLERGYDKDQEFAADEGAVQILIRAAYDPYALIDFFDVLERVEGSEHDGWFKTHPSPKARKERLLSFLEKQGAAGRSPTPELRTQRFEQNVRW